MNRLRFNVFCSCTIYSLVVLLKFVGVDAVAACEILAVICLNLFKWLPSVPVCIIILKQVVVALITISL